MAPLRFVQDLHQLGRLTGPNLWRVRLQKQMLAERLGLNAHS